MQLTVMLDPGESGPPATCRLVLAEWANKKGQGKDLIQSYVSYSPNMKEEDH